MIYPFWILSRRPCGHVDCSLALSYDRSSLDVFRGPRRLLEHFDLVGCLVVLFADRLSLDVFGVELVDC